MLRNCKGQSYCAAVVIIAKLIFFKPELIGPARDARYKWFIFSSKKDPAKYRELKNLAASFKFPAMACSYINIYSQI